MKWKKLVLLGLCMVLMGCGNAGNSGNGAGQEGNGGGEFRSDIADTRANGRSDAGEANGGAGSEAGDISGEAQSQGGGSVVKLGTDEREEIPPVKLDNALQRAAFLADRVYEADQKSTLVSPLSLEMALGLVTEGASGETAKELYKYLGNENYADWAREYMDFAKSLDTKEALEMPSADGTEKLIYESGSRYTFHYELANSIWVRQDDKLKEAYEKLVKEKFSAEAVNVDFAGEPTETAARINGWCDEHTHGMIPKIVEPEMFSSDLAAIIMNTVYFESPWADKWGLVEHEFTDKEGNKTTREMLSDTLGVYYENEYATAFAKSYYNGFEFIGILPKQEGDFEISDLGLESLLESKTYDVEVKAIAPKLNFDTATKPKQIVRILEAQGIHRAFQSDAAEFDRMVEERYLYIDDILQKCKIEMDEEGTRAAAVTAIIMREAMAMAPEPKSVKEVYLDRPFAFLIYDSVNDQIVFVGKVTEL